MIFSLTTPFAAVILVLSGFLLSSFALTHCARRISLKTIHSNALVKNGSGKRQEPEVYAFTKTFPPSRRDAMVNSTDPCASKYRALLSTGPELPEKSIQRTPTGFSAADIHRVGSFPDYAVLSGVPHPKPCPSFDIHKAVFRPFRPFRWTYHQTMCEWLPPAISLSLQI